MAHATTESLERLHGTHYQMGFGDEAKRETPRRIPAPCGDTPQTFPQGCGDYVAGQRDSG